MCRDFPFRDDLSCIQYAVPVMMSWPFRVSNFVHLLLSTLGTLFLAWTIVFRIPHFPVHQNLKLISYFFVGNLLLNSVIMVVATVHILSVSFSFENPCDAFLPPAVYRIINSLITFTSYAQTWLMLGVLVERSVATKRSDEYEKWGRKLGRTLVIAALFCAFLEYIYVFGFFESEIFASREVSYVFWPDGSKKHFNHTLALSIICSLTGLIISCYLYKYNMEERKKQIRFCLSKRYQISENVRTTELVLCVSITTTAAFIFSTILVLSARLSYNSIFGENIVAYSTARSACYPMPALSVLIPVSVLVTKRRQSTKVEIMKKQAESIEYERILNEQWEQWAKPSTAIRNAKNSENKLTTSQTI